MCRPTAFIFGAALTIAASAVTAQERVPLPALNGASPGSQSDSHAATSRGAISQDDVRRDLEQAGFDNIEFLESAYVVRATNKNGTKLVMTITPQDVRAIEVSPSKAGASPGPSSAPSAQNSGAGVSGQPGNKNGPTPSSSGTQANNQGPQQNETVREQDSAKIPGKPGGKSGPAVMPPSGEPK
jgi:hypothetical protein